MVLRCFEEIECGRFTIDAFKNAFMRINDRSVSNKSNPSVNEPFKNNLPKFIMIGSVVRRVLNVYV